MFGYANVLVECPLPMCNGNRTREPIPKSIEKRMQITTHYEIKSKKNAWSRSDCLVANFDSCSLCANGKHSLLIFLCYRFQRKIDAFVDCEKNNSKCRRGLLSGSFINCDCVIYIYLVDIGIMRIESCRGPIQRTVWTLDVKIISI